MIGVRHLLDVKQQGTLRGPNFAVRKSTLVKVGGFNKSVSFHGEDTELSLRIPELGRIIFDKNNVIDSSPRRFDRGGVLTMTWKIVSSFIRLVVTDGRSDGRSPSTSV